MPFKCRSSNPPRGESVRKRACRHFRSSRGKNKDHRRSFIKTQHKSLTQNCEKNRISYLIKKEFENVTSYSTVGKSSSCQKTRSKSDEGWDSSSRLCAGEIEGR